MAYQGGGGGRGRESNNNESFHQHHQRPTGTTTRGVSFETFFEGWLIRQNHYREQLRSAVVAAAAAAAAVASEEVEEDITTGCSSNDELKTLISKVLSHYQQYFEAKYNASRRNVFILFAPPWFNSYEKTFLWIAGFKPGLALKLINHSVKDLSEEQNKSINKLTGVMRRREKELNDELALIQESMASPQWVELTRRAGRLVDGETLEVESAFQSLKEAMEGLVVGADYLRITTATKIVEILNPPQAVRFLAAATQLQLSIRMLGSRREAAAAAASAAHTNTRRNMH